MWKRWNCIENFFTKEKPLCAYKTVFIFFVFASAEWRSLANCFVPNYTLGRFGGKNGRNKNFRQGQQHRLYY